MTNRPVVNAGRILGALSAVAGAVPILGSAFGWFVWDVDQLEAYTIAVGTVVGALALAFGVRVEKEVTPVGDPRDNELIPLVPIADDGYEDELPDF